MGLIMDTLPDISQSCVEMAITWHLGRAQPDAVGDVTVTQLNLPEHTVLCVVLFSSYLSPQIPLGHYVEEYFTEPRAKELIHTFQKDLKIIEEKILEDNQGVELPYLYLCPTHIENSITI